MTIVGRFSPLLCIGWLVAILVPATANASGGVALFDRVAGGGADFSSSTVAADAPRRSILVSQGSYNGGYCAYRAANPGILCLLYKNGMFSSSGSNTAASSPAYVAGVSYAYANANDPQWFLLNSSGARLYNPDYPTLWAMDVGNTAYQNAWAANAITAARQYNWGGVFADDLACYPWNLTGTPAKYPTLATWDAAVQSFLDNVGAQVHAAGLKLISNSAACGPYGTTLHNFEAAEDGVMEEGWMRDTTDPHQALASAADGVWVEQLRALVDAETNGKYYLAELPAIATDTQAIRYGLATQLLGAAGHSMFDISGAPSEYAQASWFPEYDTARQLGTPSGAYYQPVVGVYRRDFSNGTVLVNPSGSTVTVALGGTYSGSGLTNVTSATMAPQTGLILAKSGSSGSGSGSGGSGSGGAGSSPSPVQNDSTPPNSASNKPAPNRKPKLSVFTPDHQAVLNGKHLIATVGCSAACVILAEAEIKVGKAKPLLAHSKLKRLRGGGKAKETITLSKKQLSKIKEGLRAHQQVIAVVAGALINATTGKVISMTPAKKVRITG